MTFISHRHPKQLLLADSSCCLTLAGRTLPTYAYLHSLTVYLPDLRYVAIGGGRFLSVRSMTLTVSDPDGTDGLVPGSIPR